ncbi:nucleoside-diphosphate-sugar epimerase [Thermanaerovibrio velox DSM 12556]|uniref:Nucleoside-diphosphate-sugar epimerase n=1 Tax=Thermanaerovibrio velox DSM 12556 TaxID=926567 RepID=H0UMT8_9BACT|nr:nucleoside-diphosphate-sugar epimerase [Thermanaerovibrio velox DSM 12556]
MVTGAGGFIGSHLVEALVSKGHDVRAFVRYNSSNSWGWLESSPCRDQLEIISGDIRDYDIVRSAVRGCDMVFHLAALIGIPYSYVSPLAYVRTNVEGTYNVLQASLEWQVGRVVHTSTSEVYGTAQYVPIDESHPVNPQSPYAATKSGADQLAISYYRSFELPVTVVRPFNTYGPRQSARAIIPTVMSQILEGKRSISLGSLSPTRDLTFVSDTVSGFIAAAESPNAVGEVVNLGTGREISIGDLVKKIAGVLGVDVEVVTEECRVRPPKSEVERLCSNPSKMLSLTGWSASVALEDGLCMTADWMKENRRIYKGYIYNV